MRRLQWREIPFYEAQSTGLSPIAPPDQETERSMRLAGVLRQHATVRSAWLGLELPICASESRHLLV